MESFRGRGSSEHAFRLGRTVEVALANGAVGFSTIIPVACDPLFVVRHSSCQDDGGHLELLIADNDELARYDVYVDDATTPLDGFTDLNAHDGLSAGYLDLGAYADGTHRIWVDLKGDDSDSFVFEALDITLDCGGAESGGSIPDTGSNTAPLMFIASLLIAAGAGLLALRRVRTA